MSTQSPASPRLNASASQENDFRLPTHQRRQVPRDRNVMAFKKVETNGRAVQPVILIFGSPEQLVDKAGDYTLYVGKLKAETSV